MLGLTSTAKTAFAEAQQVKRYGKRTTDIPGLARIEFIFFPIAVKVPCSGFRTGIMPSTETGGT